MKFWKHTLITAFAFIGISTTILYTSCEKDSCTDLKCKNGGTCAEGFCRCPTGYEGTECEINAATKFLGTFYGSFACAGKQPLNDTVDIWLYQAPDKVQFVERSMITDTLIGTVSLRELTFDQQVSDNYRKFTRAEILGDRITVYTQEVYDASTGNMQNCNFIGFK